jgi:hypothetical protein
MRTLIVYESMFGNTRHLAEVIASEWRAGGQDVMLVPAAEAPSDLTGFDIVAIGAPTHAHSLPAPASRTQAATWAADPSKALTLTPDAEHEGVREWLDRVIPPQSSPRVAVFSTRADIPRIFAGSATAAITKRLHKRDVVVADHEDFLVALDNRLASGEDQRARTWAQSLLPVSTPEAER